MKPFARLGAIAALGVALGGFAWAPAAAAAESRYSLANGCLVVRSQATGELIAKQGNAYASGGEAAPLRFRATALGRYLLYDDQRRFVAANGDSVAAAGEPSPNAEWRVRGAGDGSFRLLSHAASRPLTVNGQGALALAAAGAEGASERFTFERAEGCADYPEIEVGASGEPAPAPQPYGESRGYIDLHLHVMFFEALGGRFHCGRPWHPYGVAYALPDCAEYEGPGGLLAPVQNFLNYGTPVHTHDTVGWPTFRDWPHHSSLTYEGVYFKWLERAWRGGLRLMVALNTDNEGLCELYPFRRQGYNCNEMDSVRREIGNLYELQDYIDAQEGGPGKGWFRIVRNPFQARRTINQGKLAVVIGIETSKLFDCGLQNNRPLCTPEQITERLDEAYGMGVRQMELINKFDNAFGGVAGDGDILGPIVNTANFLDTGRFWEMGPCADRHSHDREQITQTDIGLAFVPLLTPGTLPVYGPGPHCNQKGLSQLGEHLVREMMKRGMLIDPDHLSAIARSEAMTLAEAERYSGMVSSHSWADDRTYARIHRVGGVVTPMAGNSASFVRQWRFQRSVRSKRHLFGIGYGSDMQGLAKQGGPRNGPHPVSYPFTSFDGAVTLDRNRSGERVWDINNDGVAHYGMYPDWVEDLRMIAGDRIVRDMTRGAEAYLQSWERAVGVPGPRCRAASARFTPRGVKRVRIGLRANKLLRRSGQPQRRTDTWRWCVRGKRGQLKAMFTPAGRTGLVAATAPGYRLQGVHPGMNAKRLPRGAKPAGPGLYVARAGARNMAVFGTKRGRISFVGVAPRNVARSATLRALAAQGRLPRG